MADTPTPNYGFIIQQPGTNPKTWGGKLNANWASIDGLLYTASTDASAAASAAALAMPRTGGAFTGDVTLAEVTPVSASAGYRGAPVIGFDTDRTLIGTDAGKMLRLFGPTSRTLTIPPVSSVGFPLGTVILLRSYTTTVPWNIARGAGVTLTVAGSSLNKNCQLATFGLASLTHEDTNIWVLSGVGAS